MPLDLCRRARQSRLSLDATIHICSSARVELKMSASPAIDRDQLRARCLDDREFIRQMLAVFREFAPQTMSQLRQSAESMALGDAPNCAA